MPFLLESNAYREDADELVFVTARSPADGRRAGSGDDLAPVTRRFCIPRPTAVLVDDDRACPAAILIHSDTRPPTVVLFDHALSVAALRAR